jgi:hypothetical protein
VFSFASTLAQYPARDKASYKSILAGTATWLTLVVNSDERYNGLTNLVKERKRRIRFPEDESLSRPIEQYA